MELFASQDPRSYSLYFGPVKLPGLSRNGPLDTPDRSRNKIQKCSYRVLAISEKKDSTPLHQGLNVMLCFGVACKACSFSQLLYAISTFRLFINENSTVNTMYDEFFITALKSSQEILAYPGNNPVNKAFFLFLVTVLTSFHCNS